MDLKRLPVVGITQGEPTGIGPEIIIKALRHPSLLRLCTPIVLGEPKYFKSLRKEIPVISPQNFKTSSYGALNLSCQLLFEKKIDAVVTAPVDKYRISKEEGVIFLGHTEFFKKACEKTFARPFHSTMFFVSPKEKLALVTTHLPLKNVAKILSKDLLQKTILNVYLGLKSLFRIPNPKLALLGLNPHAGEKGLLGQEEKLIFAPVLRWAHQRKIQLEGPFSADSFFSTRWRLFDATFALYPYQGLSPL